MAGLRPNDILGVEAASLGNATTLLALVGFVVEKAREAKHFRKDCLELANTCVALTAAFTDAGDQLNNIKAKEDFVRCLEETGLFASECQEANILHTAWELLFAKKLSQLRGRLYGLQSTVNSELMVSLLQQ
jgi:hypothetical protein